MPHIAINRCYGGFGLSDQACDYLARKKNVPEVYARRLKRNDPDLIAMILAHQNGNITFPINGFCADVGLAEISEDAYRLDAWKIDEYDGVESVDVDTSFINLHYEKIKAQEEKNRRGETFHSVITMLSQILHSDSVDADKKIFALQAMFEPSLIERHFGNELELDKVSDTVDEFFVSVNKTLDTLPYFGEDMVEAKKRFEELS